MPDRAAARTLLFSQKNVNTKQKQTERLISRSVSCFPVPSGLPHRSHCVPINMNRCGYGDFLWRSGRDLNPRAAFDDNTISSRARYDHFDTTAYLNAQQQASLYQNWARSQYPIFAFPQKRDGAALRLFSFCLYFNCSSAASFRQQQNTSIACCSSSTGGRDGATRILLSFGSTP